jgi:hypothetical protein
MVVMVMVVAGWVAVVAVILAAEVAGVVVEAEAMAVFLVCLVAAERLAAHVVPVLAARAALPPVSSLSRALPRTLELLLPHWRCPLMGL